MKNILRLVILCENKSKMKKFLIIVFIILSANAFSQKIEMNLFDKYDSVQKIETAIEKLAGRPNKLEVTVTCNKLLSSKYLKGGNELKFVVYLWFSPDDFISIQKNESSVKVEFEDGKIVEYLYTGSSKVYEANGFGGIYFSVYEDDKLTADNVKSIRINFSSGHKDFPVDEKKKALFKNMLSLVQKTYNDNLKVMN